MEPFSIPLALIAGLFSILSPCILPLIPVVLGAAVSEHKWGPTALACGLALSFTAIGMFVATVGYAVGLDGEIFRNIAAVSLIGVGAVLVVPNWQAQMALAGGPIGNWTGPKFGDLHPKVCGGNSVSASCSARRGVLAWGRRWVRRPYLQHKVANLDTSR